MTAPHVSTRELSRPDFPAVVHTYTDLLRVLSTSEDQTATPKHLAQATDRDGSNIRRDAQKLRDAGVITIRADGAWTLTDKGGRWVVGQDVAAGAAQVGEASSNAPRWPADKIRRNPINRVVTTASVEGMADAIEGAEDILIPVRLTPADANGVRMLLAGERRWEGAKLCERRGALPEALKAGIPFTEGEVSADDGALIAVIENTARKDLSPWEDAQLLKAAADGLGITNASELARRIGRAREGDRGGVRDVQTKLRVAREATPEAIATYEETGSWDRLRDSVTTPKAPTLSDLVAEHGVAALGSAGPPPDEVSDQTEMFDAGEVTLSPLAELALVEVLWALRFAPFKSEEFVPAVLTNGYAYRSSGLMEAVRSEYLQYTGYDLEQGRACVVLPTSKGREWAAERFETGAPTLSKLIEWREKVEAEPGATDDAEDEGFSTIALNSRRTRERLTARKPQTPVGPHVVNGIDYGNATRANDARRAIGILPPLPPANYGGAKADPFSPGIGAQILGNHLRGLEGDDERSGDVTEVAPEPAAPSIPLGQVLKNMADEANEQKRHGLRATLEVLVERLEPVLEALNGDRTDGILPLDSDDADWFADQLTEASRWAEDALAVTGAFDPLPGDEIARPSPTEPAVPIRKSIMPDHIVCLEDGRKFKCLKRHLRTRYNLSPDAYRAKWGLARDYPMVAPNYAKAREDLARQMGLKAAAKS